MSCCSLWAFLNSQFLGTFLLFVTLIVLGVYAYDTRRIARASLAQRDLTHRPCVVIWRYHGADPLEMVSGSVIDAAHEGRSASELRIATTAELPAQIELKNVGLGPALAVEARKLVNGCQAGVPIFFPHMSPNNAPIQWRPKIASEKKGTVWSLEISYLGLTGATFITRYTLDGESILSLQTHLVGEKGRL